MAFFRKNWELLDRNKKFHNSRMFKWYVCEEVVTGRGQLDIHTHFGPLLKYFSMTKTNTINLNLEHHGDLHHTLKDFEITGCF